MPSATSQKRKLPFGGLQRRVRARREEPEPELEEYSDDDSQAEGDSEDGDSDDMSERGSEASDQVIFFFYLSPRKLPLHGQYTHVYNSRNPAPAAKTKTKTRTMRMRMRMRMIPQH